MNTSTIVLASFSVYPLKSGRGFNFTDSRIRVRVTELGFEGDREFMLIGAETTDAITQRQCPSLCRLSLVGFSNSLVLTFGEAQQSFRIDTPSAATPIRAKLHSELVIVLEVDSEISSWISERIGMTVRLVRRVKKFRRSAGFQDARPFQLISQATIDDVVRQTGSEIPRLSFRPNLIISGVKAWEEDSWTELRIGEQLFRAEPCPRCVVPTIDQRTGVAFPAINRVLRPTRIGEYLRGAESRKGVLVGRYLTPLKPFVTLGVGDRLQVLE